MKKWIFLIFTIVTLGSIVYFGFIKHTNCQLRTPDIVGLDVDEAKTFLKRRGMKLVIMDTTNNPGTNRRQIVINYQCPGQ